MVSNISHYLHVDDPSKRHIEERLLLLFEDHSLIPAFPECVIRLFKLLDDESTSMDDFARVISMDAGLTARTIRVASSSAFAARQIDSVQQAVLLVGLSNLRRIAFSVSMINALSRFSKSVDWRPFWLHNILVARLTERIASTFRPINGREYLAGLLHDVGKLIIEHSFPDEHKKIVQSALARQCSQISMEKEVLGLNHTQIGAAFCEYIRVQDQIVQAILFHHTFKDANHIADSNGDGGFLAACISLAVRISRQVSKGPLGDISETVERSVEWLFLEHMVAPRRLVLDIANEVKLTREELKALFV